MKRLLVVDDELHVAESIGIMVKRDLHGEFEVAGMASTGKEAIKKSQTLSPDIILMDVRMPGISGLDAIREIRRHNVQALFILVTAYERFDIARDAVELGVLGYLLKPVSKDKLTVLLRSAATVIDQRVESERSAMEYRERGERAVEFTEAAFLRSIMLAERLGPDLPHYEAALGLRFEDAIVGAIAILPERGSIDPEAESRGLYKALKDLVRYKTKALMGPLVSGTAVIFLSPGTKEDGENIRRLIGESWKAECSTGLIRMGFSSRGSDPGKLWSQALRSLHGENAKADDSLLEKEDEFLESVADGEVERARAAFAALAEGADPSRRTGRMRCYSVMAMLASAYRLLLKHSMLEPDRIGHMMDFDDLLLVPDEASFALAARARMAALAESMERSPRWSRYVSRAMALIKDQFGSQISLETVADAIGVSPTRLSKLLVEETGKGFSNILIDCRIERAKELLAVPDASIKQVSLACGYPDPNYFSRLFKKTTGLTPTAFYGNATGVHNDS